MTIRETCERDIVHEKAPVLQQSFGGTSLLLSPKGLKRQRSIRRGKMAEKGKSLKGYIHGDIVIQSQVFLLTYLFGKNFSVILLDKHCYKS